MISKKIIEDQAIKNQTRPENIAREYLQHLFLRYFYQERASENILFKGGTALRLIYQSPRFSEDLDFSAFKISISKIENLIESTLLKINQEEKIKLEEAKATKGGYLSIFQGLIGQIWISGQLQISQRPKKRVPGQILTIQNPLTAPYTLWALTEEQLVEEKLTALLTRGKMRDFYDLYFILRLRLKINLTPKRNSQILRQIEKHTNLSFARELKPFLPQSHHPVLKNFKENLKRELEKYL